MREKSVLSCQSANKFHCLTIFLHMNVDHNLQQVKKVNMHRSLCLSFENVQLPDDFLNVSLASDMIDT